MSVALDSTCHLGIFFEIALNSQLRVAGCRILAPFSWRKGREAMTPKGAKRARLDG
jgi:hypothetical protein